MTRKTAEKTNSSRMKRGEIWLADLGYVGKVRPVLVLSVEPGVFDAQGIGTTDRSHFIRMLGVLEEKIMRQVEKKTRAWLGL